MSAKGYLGVILGLLLVVATAYSGSGGYGMEAASVIGLWRLEGTMPPGAPSEGGPVGLSDNALYWWFHPDGTVSLRIDAKKSKRRGRGFWKQNGRKIVISWENGLRIRVTIVRLKRNSLIVLSMPGLAGRAMGSRLFSGPCGIVLLESSDGITDNRDE
ncbi:hypothetical protein ACFL2Q_06555 [Thermodesulfobacteriota bacterium]